MGWYVFQFAIVVSVVFSNIHWQWTPNMYLPTMIGIGVAYLLTTILSKLWSVLQRRYAG